MFLVNTRTSGTQSSGVITHIDMRGGAAVTGDNGVGKTTTLQLIALFFGYSPNQIFATNANKVPLLRFVLPHPQCAIVFEYQRGDGPDDVNCAVLRRQDHTDAPSYRFVTGEFLAQNFIEHAPEDPFPVYLDDDGMVRAATRAGVQVSPKQTAPAYRNIILNTRSYNKDVEEVRKLAGRFSFSLRRLPLLDRLIACVVKEQVNFRDLSDVVATIVFEQTGGITKDRDDFKRLALKQGKTQIERWLRDRDACEKAQKAEGDVQALRELLQDLRVNGLRLGELRGQGRQLRALQKDSLRQQQSELTRMEGERDEVARADTKSSERLAALVGQAKTDWNRSSNEFDTENAKKNHFAEQDAPDWAKKIDNKPALEAEYADAAAEVARIEGAASGISREFQQEQADVKDRAAKAVKQMQDGKKALAEAYQREVSDLDSREKAAQKELRTAQEEQVSGQLEILERFNQELGQAQAAMQEPRAAASLLERERVALQALSEHNNLLLESQADMTRMDEALRQAQVAFDAAEAVIVDCNVTLGNAQQALVGAQRLMNPHPDTLHGTLIGSSDTEWKQTVARVIAPELLDRTDLHPTQLADTVHSLYGWGLNLEAIAIPDWTNDTILRERVRECEQTVNQCRTDLAQARESLKPCAQARQEASERHQLVKARHDLLAGKTAEIRLETRSCQEAVADAQKAAKDAAEQQFQRAKQAAVDAKQQSRQLEARQAAERNDLAEEFRTAREQSANRRKDGDDKIDVAVRAFEKKTEERCHEIELARQSRLNQEGVDTLRLNAQVGERNRLRQLLEDLARQQPLVNLWNEWLRTGGPGKVEDLRIQRDRYENVCKQATSEQNRHEGQAKERERKYKTDRGELIATIQRIEGEVNSLDKLDLELEDYSVRMDGRVTTDTVVGELVDRKATLQSDRDALHGRIDTQYRRIEAPLMTQDSAVKDFLQSSLDDLGASPSIVQRAERLAQAYDRIGPEVLAHVNTELNLILNNIGQFRTRIQNFESEVKAFNTKLQAGLNSVVSGFDRIRDLRINVVTDFDKLDFVGKLKSLEEVTRQHREQNKATYRVLVPPATSGFALREFVKLLGSGAIEVDLSQHITLSGSVNDDGLLKPFHRESELEHVSSNGLTAIVLITLLSGLLNVIRGSDSIFIPWVSDEVGRFDGPNFQHLMEMLRANRIDVVTASPALTPAAFSHFAIRYRFGPRGSISVYNGQRRPHRRGSAAGPATQEASP